MSRSNTRDLLGLLTLRKPPCQEFSMAAIFQVQDAGKQINLNFNWSILLTSGLSKDYISITMRKTSASLFSQVLRRIDMCRGTGVLSFNIWPSEPWKVVGQIQLVCSDNSTSSILKYGENSTTLSGQPSFCSNAIGQMKNAAIPAGGKITYR